MVRVQAIERKPHSFASEDYTVVLAVTKYNQCVSSRYGPTLYFLKTLDEGTIGSVGENKASILCKAPPPELVMFHNRLEFLSG